MEAATRDNVTKAVTPARSVTRAKGTSANKRKYTRSDLPDLMQEAAEDKWSKKVIPSLILWYGDEENVWSVDEEDLSHVLAAIIKTVYPTFNKLDEIKHGLPIYSLVRPTLVVRAPQSSVLLLSFMSNNVTIVLFFSYIARLMTRLSPFAPFRWNAFRLNIASYLHAMHGSLIPFPYTLYGRPSYSCVTRHAAFSLLSHSPVLFISALAFVLRTLLGLCAASPSI